MDIMLRHTRRVAHKKGKNDGRKSAKPVHGVHILSEKNMYDFRDKYILN